MKIDRTIAKKAWIISALATMFVVTSAHSAIFYAVPFPNQDNHCNNFTINDMGHHGESDAVFASENAKVLQAAHAAKDNHKTWACVTKTWHKGGYQPRGGVAKSHATRQGIDITWHITVRISVNGHRSTCHIFNGRRPNAGNDTLATTCN